MNTPKLLTLKVLALKNNSSGNVTIPEVTCWNGEKGDWIELCKTINEIDYNAKALENIQIQTNKFSPLTKEKCTQIKDYTKIELLKDVNFFWCDKLPCDFLRLKKTIIVKSEEKISDAVSAIIPGIGRKIGFENVITDKKYRYPLSYNETLLNNIQMVAFYNIYGSTDNTSIENTNSNVIAYEFLQNADDSKRRNRTDQISNDFSVDKEKNNNEIVLRYSEAGFSAWDFYCIITRGRSGNDQSEENTGRFGTGFKSVYAICNKVEIYSKDIKCVLDTEDIPDAGDDDNLKLIQGFYKNDTAKNRNRHSPVPVFGKISGRENSNETEIHLYFKDTQKRDELYEQITAPENYIFLKNIEPPKSSPYLRENGYYYCCPDKTEGQKPILEMYFPPVNEDYNPHKNLHPIYCNLPMDATEKFLFFMNVPQVITTEDRRSFVCDGSSTGNINAIANKYFWDKIFPNIQTAFETFAKSHPDIAYKYAEWNKKTIKFACNSEGINFSEEINIDFPDFKIIPCKKFDKGLCSLNDIINGRVRVLTDNFYSWLEKHKECSPTIPFVEKKVIDFIKVVNPVINFTPWKTVLDTLGYDDDKLVERCLDCLRPELYYKEDNVRIDKNDKLFGIIKDNSLEKLAQFNSEIYNKDINYAVELFENGMVAFKTMNGSYSVYDSEKTYYIDWGNSNTSEGEGFDRVIVSLPAVAVSDEVLEISKLFCNKETAKNVLQNENDSFIEFAISRTKSAESRKETFRCLEQLVLENVEKAYKPFLLLVKQDSWTISAELLNSEVIDKDLIKATNLQFTFDDNSKIIQLSTTSNVDISLLYENTVDEPKRNEIAQKFHLFADIDKVDKEAKDVYFYEISKNLTGYVNGIYDSKGIAVIVHGNGKKNEALKKFLNKLFGCDTFSVCKEYKRMESNPSDESKEVPFNGYNDIEKNKGKSDYIKNFLDVTLSEAQTLLKEYSEDELKKHLINTYQPKSVKNQGVDVYLDFKGYGISNKSRKKKVIPICPVCKGELYAEASNIKIRSIVVNQKRFPLLLCSNCYKTLDFTKSAKLDISESQCKDYLNKILFNKKATVNLSLEFSGNDNIKESKLKLTFLHKAMLYSILFPKNTNEQHNDSERYDQV